MIKKIPVSALRPGMYVADFNAGWLDHPFLRNALAIESDADVRRVIDSGIRELFIDTVRGLDVDDAPTAEEADAETARQLQAMSVAPVPEIADLRRATPLAREMAHARATYVEASRIVRRLMEDIRLGRQVEIKALSKIVRSIADSVIRNPNALMTMRRLKHIDDYTFQHCVSVCTMLATFARALGMDEETMHAIALGGLIHDIGKVQVSLSILNKPGKLTDAEFDHMKSHVALGETMTAGIADLPPLALEVLSLHHERFDGSGYPRRLKGEAISPVGRMAAVVDVYDAITSDRVYHRGIGPAVAMQRLFEWSRYHFDPQLVQAFIRCVGIYPIGTVLRLDGERLAVVVEQREGKLLQPRVRVVFDARLRRPLSPIDLDLAESGGQDAILGHVVAEEWKIDVARFLGS